MHLLGQVRALRDRLAQRGESLQGPLRVLLDHRAQAPEGVLALAGLPDQSQMVHPVLRKGLQVRRHHAGAHQTQAADGDGGVLAEAGDQVGVVDDVDQALHDGLHEGLDAVLDAHGDLTDGPASVVAHADEPGGCCDAGAACERAARGMRAGWTWCGHGVDMV